jgi:hypothetical protein
MPKEMPAMTNTIPLHYINRFSNFAHPGTGREDRKERRPLPPALDEMVDVVKKTSPGPYLPSLSFSAK